MLNSRVYLLRNLFSRNMSSLRFLNTIRHKKIINLFENSINGSAYFRNYKNHRCFNSSSIVSQNDSIEALSAKEPKLSKKMVKSVVAERGYFDTHAFIGALLQNGFTQQQAEIVCLLFKDVTNYISEDIKKECVTRPGQDLAIQQVMIHIGSLKKDMIILEKSEFSALRQENEKLVMELKSLREQLNDEIIKLRGGFTLDINLEKNRSSEASYLVNNQIHQISSRIDTEISNVKATLEQFKAETVKYIAGSLLTALVIILGALRYFTA